MYRKCSIECDSCNGQNNPHDNCLTCRPGYWKWYTHARCYTYCPSFSIVAARAIGFGPDVRGQYKTSANNSCQICDSRCNFCNGPANTDCYSCVGGYRLLDDTSECVGRFSAGTIANEHTCHPRQCENFGTANSGCPV